MEDSDRLSALRNELSRRLGCDRYELLVGAQTSLVCDGSTLQVGSPSQFQLQWIRRRLHAEIQSSCRQIWEEDLRIEYRVDPSLESPAETESLQQAEPTPSEKPERPRKKISSDSAKGKTKTATPRQTSSFDNFVVGKSNELACRTARSVAGSLGHYGPLLLFGPSGVGKTHLQYAMLHQLRRSNSRIRSLRLTSEQFTGEFLAALDRRALPSFRHKYRSIDVLLVDDIQFLVNKRATLDELLYTIDTLHERGRQVVLTCDRSPGDLQGVSAELVSRISGGLAIPIGLPDFETRIGIVRQLAVRMQIRGDEELVSLVASQVVGSARQLQGAMNYVTATAVAHGQPVTADLARTTLVDFVRQNTPVVRLADIQQAVCQVFGVEAASLKSDRKSRSIAEPRMLAMWLARKYTRSALGEISEFFGRRSHSTVISAQRKIDGMVSQGAEISVADRPCRVEEAIRKVELALRTA